MTRSSAWIRSWCILLSLRHGQGPNGTAAGVPSTPRLQHHRQVMSCRDALTGGGCQKESLCLLPGLNERPCHGLARRVDTSDTRLPLRQTGMLTRWRWRPQSAVFRVPTDGTITHRHSFRKPAIAPQETDNAQPSVVTDDKTTNKCDWGAVQKSKESLKAKVCVGPGRLELPTSGLPVPLVRLDHTGYETCALANCAMVPVVPSASYDG
jgi:hypothetical protein